MVQIRGRAVNCYRFSPPLERRYKNPPLETVLHFAKLPYVPGETIAAVATPPGEGGVAIIRISGNNALTLCDKIFSGAVHSFASHTVHYGKIIDEAGKVLDDVLLIPMRGKRSFTGEETVEIHCHGGRLITRRVLELVLRSGARQALPGEFSFRAFINGRIDLSQAEAIQELIAAKNERALDAAEAQLQGRLSQKISSFQKRLTEIAAIVEAWVDFPEEGLEFASNEEIVGELATLSTEIKKLIDTFHDGRIIHDGIAITLTGAPNVGKSSLMNALLDKERAIVSSTPGTTRDIVEDELRLHGLNIKLIDTAGIREAKEEIEEEGIRRSRSAIERADLVLFVLDATAPTNREERDLFESLPKEKTIVVWNKIDLPHDIQEELPSHFSAKVSAKNRQGIEELGKLIDEVIWCHGPPSKEELLITNIRHKEALEEAHIGTVAVMEGLLCGLSPEFLAFDLRTALNALGKVIGSDISEDILDAIFSKFCIGK